MSTPRNKTLTNTYSSGLESNEKLQLAPKSSIKKQYKNGAQASCPKHPILNQHSLYLQSEN